MATGNWIFAFFVVVVLTAIIIPAYLNIRKEKKLDEKNKGKTTRIIKRWMADGSQRYFCQWFNHQHDSICYDPYGWNTYGYNYEYGMDGQPLRGFETPEEASTWWHAREAAKQLQKEMRARKDVCVKEPI